MPPPLPRLQGRGGATRTVEIPNETCTHPNVARPQQVPKRSLLMVRMLLSAVLRQTCPPGRHYRRAARSGTARPPRRPEEPRKTFHRKFQRRHDDEGETARPRMPRRGKTIPVRSRRGRAHAMGDPGRRSQGRSVGKPSVAVRRAARGARHEHADDPHAAPHTAERSGP
jgi:hypothetical protein